MDLSLSEEEQELAAAARAFVSRQVTIPDLVKLHRSDVGYDPAWTKMLADAGWLALLVPEDLGGAGATLLQAAIVWEELGRAPLPGPYLFSSVVAASLLAHAQASPARDELLGAVASGEATVAPILDMPDRDWSGLRGDESLAPVVSGTLTGTFPFVPYGRAATHLLIPVRAGVDGGGAGLAVVPASDDAVGVRRLAGWLAYSDEVDVRGAPVETVVRMTPAGIERALA